ncbi:hypothetical protein WG66_001371 [Moniliophthora roreri]|nr:hypothetical protein WG66_001371 [Moniliophthora roreri]
MASVRTFQIRVADGTTVTLTTTVPGTLSIEFPRIAKIANPGIHIDPQERPDNLIIPITIDKPLLVPEPSKPESSSSGGACTYESPKQPTKQELKHSLKENNIVPLDHAYKPNNPPAAEIYRPFQYIVDYDECLRKGARANTPFISSWKPDPNQSITENLASLPRTPPKYSWGMNSQASIDYPAIYLNAHPTTDDLISLLKTQPYEFAPPRIPRPRRDYPIPGKILYRLLELGWITEREAVQRWLDIDWFSLRDYRAHLEKARSKGRVAEWRPVYSEKEKEMMGGNQTLTLEQRLQVRRQRAVSAERSRWQMECSILEAEEGVNSEGEVVNWFRESGFGWVVEKEPRESTAKDVNQEAESHDDAKDKVEDDKDGISTTGATHSQASTPSPSPVAGETSAFRASASVFPVPASNPHTPTPHDPIRSLTHLSSLDAEESDRMDGNSEAASKSKMSRTSVKRKLEDEQDDMYESDSADETSKRRKVLLSPESLSANVSSVTFPALSPHTSPMTPSNARATVIPDTPRDEMGPRSVHPPQMGSPTSSRKSSRLSIAAAQNNAGSSVPAAKSKEEVKAGGKKKAGARKKGKSGARGK